MTAIRKSRLQYIHFQCLTIKTTKIGYSNDRFGIIFQTMLDSANMRAEESIFIDDSASNIATATKMGFHTIHLATNADFRPELEKMLE